MVVSSQGPCNGSNRVTGAAMAKNILIFSDGTGQAGGIAFDEDRTNIYKLYRATRCGPDSCINPDEQVAFYDPGLGSPADGGFMLGKVGRWMYRVRRYGLRGGTRMKDDRDRSKIRRIWRACWRAVAL